MKTYNYQGVSNSGEKILGSIEAQTEELAIGSLQNRGILLTSLKEQKIKTDYSLSSLFNKVPAKEVVFFSRQIATLFEANVSAYKAFSLIAEQSPNELLRSQLKSVTGDLSAGSTISNALSAYPDTFSNFFVNMVRAGEESGKLSQTFTYLADYLERQYEITRKTKSALIYPAFVVIVFFLVMIMMMTVIIPKLGVMIKDSDQALPFFTQIILGISDFMVNYGLYILIVFLLFGAFVFYYLTTANGKDFIDSLKLKFPAIKNLYKKLYLARIADNLDTMLSSGIPIVKTLDVTASVVDNKVYERVINSVSDEIKAGVSLSSALARHPEIPMMLSQMVRVGEETGMLSQVLKTLSRFYKREVDQAVDTIVSLIEPVMIVFLGLGVGILLVSVLMPIYNITSAV